MIGFGYWAKCFRLRLEISLNRFVKFEISILRVQRNALNNVFFENFMSSFTFGGWARLFGHQANFLNMVDKIASDASIITLWGKLIYWTKSFRVFIIPGPWAKIYQPYEEIFRLSVRLFSRRFFKLHSTCPENHWEGIFFLEVFFIVFGHWAKIFRASVEFFLRACQNCIVSIRKNLSSKKQWQFHGFWAVSDFEQKTFGFLSKIFRRDCQICILRVQRNTLKKNLFFENFLPLVFFGPWEESFRHSGNNFKKLLWKLLSTCPWDKLEETFLLKILCFWSSLENESKVLRLLSTFPTWKLELLFTCPWDLFQQTYVSGKLFFRLLKKNFRKCCEICFIPVHGIISRKNIFF